MQQIVDYITEVVTERAKSGKNYGLILIPEGIVEFIQEVGNLIGEINMILGGDKIS